MFGRVLNKPLFFSGIFNIYLLIYTFNIYFLKVEDCHLINTSKMRMVVMRMDVQENTFLSCIILSILWFELFEFLIFPAKFLIPIGFDKSGSAMHSLNINQLQFKSRLFGLHVKLGFSGSNFLINLRGQFRARKICFVYVKVLGGFVVFSFCV